MALDSRSAGVATLVAVSLLAALALAFAGPIGELPGYGSFADRQTILGIPNFWNVVSNLAFLIPGVWGVAVLVGSRRPGVLAALLPSWLFVFGGAILIAFGSAYYHVAPSSAALVWDRLPMTLSFMGLFAVILGEQISQRWAARLLPVLLLVGLASVLYWRITHDLRVYVAVQYLPMLLIPLSLWLFASPLRPAWPIWAALVAYALAKVFEVFDTAMFQLLGSIGGHPLKHVLAGISVCLLVVAASRRHPVQAAGFRA